MDFQEVVRQRYACKKYDGRVVPQAQIDELLELIRLTPSGLNLQPWKIKVVTDQAIKDQLLPVSADMAQVTTCSHLLVICANTDFAGLIEKLESGMRKAGVPDQVREHVVELAKGHQAEPYEQGLAYAKNQCFILLATAIYGAKALGLDSCAMTSFNPREYSRILEIPEHLVPTVLCAVGYPADSPSPKRRLAKEDIYF